MCVCACVRAESESTYEFSSGRSLSDTLCPVEPYRMPHKCDTLFPMTTRPGSTGAAGGPAVCGEEEEGGEKDKIKERGSGGRVRAPNGKEEREAPRVAGPV